MLYMLHVTWAVAVNVMCLGFDFDDVDVICCRLFGCIRARLMARGGCMVGPGWRSAGHLDSLSRSMYSQRWLIMASCWLLPQRSRFIFLALRNKRARIRRRHCCCKLVFLKLLKSISQMAG